MIYIYLVENCYGNSNSVYIGKCTHPGQRKCQHIKKFGSESTFTIIDEVESNWKPLESYWIHQFKQWGFNMVNKNDGGGGPSSRPPEFIERLRNNRLGTKHSDDTKMKMSASNSKPKPDGFGDKLKKPNTNPWSGRPVYQCDLDGNIIQLWSSGKEASQTLSINRGSISSVLAGKYQTAGGFKWLKASLIAVALILAGCSPAAVSTAVTTDIYWVNQYGETVPIVITSEPDTVAVDTLR